MTHLVLPRRPRRLRRSEAIRRLVRETVVTPHNLIAPLFVKDHLPRPEPIDSMPGTFRLPPEALIEEARQLHQLGIPAVALFPCLPPEIKDPEGSAALDPDNLICRTVRALKAAVPDLTIIVDVALDPYTSHGHDGLLAPDGSIDNDRTVEILARMALLLARVGADAVAPSDMMDGRVGAIRHRLEEAGATDTIILAYAAKFASAYYGPFREAVGSAQAAGTPALDKRTYQLDPANAREAEREIDLDVEEGADIVMVKPAGPYLDIIRRVRERTTLPVAAYQVSGEYAQIVAAAQHGWLDLNKTRDESLLSIKRAGADMILTYFAKSFAQDYARTRAA